MDTTGVLGPIFGKWHYVGNNGSSGFVYKKMAYDYSLLTKILEQNSFKECKKYSWESFFPKGYDDYSAAYVPPDGLLRILRLFGDLFGEIILGGGTTSLSFRVTAPGTQMSQPQKKQLH